jgi:hypothetical protein
MNQLHFVHSKYMHYNGCSLPPSVLQVWWRLLVWFIEAAPRTPSPITVLRHCPSVANLCTPACFYKRQRLQNFKTLYLVWRHQSKAGIAQSLSWLWHALENGVFKLRVSVATAYPPQRYNGPGVHQQRHDELSYQSSFFLEGETTVAWSCTYMHKAQKLRMHEAPPRPHILLA